MYKIAKKHKISKQQKAKIIDELQKELQNKKDIVLIGNEGLSSSEMMQLRKDLLKKGAKLKILKNKIFLLTLSKISDLSGISKFVSGSTGIVTFTDETKSLDILKFICDYSKNNPKLVIKGSYFLGSIFDNKNTIEISQLPSKEVLIGKLLNLLIAPIYNLYSILQSPTVSFINLLEQLKQKK